MGSDVQLEEWICLLQGIWGVLLLPVALSLSLGKSRIFRVCGGIGFVLCGIFVGILCHDIHAHFSGGKLFTPFYETVLGLVAPVKKGERFIAGAAFEMNCTELKVKHRRKGVYAIGFVIPEKVNDFTPVEFDVKLTCSIYKYDGALLKELPERCRIYSGVWTWLRGGRGGSKVWYFKYEVPMDLPLNEELTIKIAGDGEIGSFLKRYPCAKVCIAKYPVK